MPSPQPEAATVHSETRAQWREHFIARQLAGLRDMGLSPEALAREEALLRGGFAGGAIFSGLPAPSP